MMWPEIDPTQCSAEALQVRHAYVHAGDGLRCGFDGSAVYIGCNGCALQIVYISLIPFVAHLSPYIHRFKPNLNMPMSPPQNLTQGE